ncbi:MAG: hypothetical protein KatS3mg011_0781 [Acidimicrobiia bacterium]|nr:MAG: hypothetical protein KatS3mg011_0781 [Acidimicrobiia bacterium]
MGNPSGDPLCPEARRDIDFVTDFTKPLAMHETPHRQITAAVSEGWVAGSALFGSIVSGTLLGYLADAWLGTDPWLVVTGVVLGSYSGFLRVWHHSRKMESRR